MRMNNVGWMLFASSSMVAIAPAAMAQEMELSVGAQPLGPAVAELARQAGVQVLIGEDLAKGRTSTVVSGRYSFEQALSILLRGTELEWRRTGTATYSIVRVAVGDAGAIPEILVVGQRQWSLNTGIRRSQDDSQPFVVIEGEAIRRSGAPNLESLLRDQLSFNAAPSTAEQSVSGRPNVSSINLRGLGERETLILVDGRRLPGVTNSDGSLGQGNITGIPMAAIERIEVLASSASGMYGNGATGGVVNIILRRDYHGGELSATYVDTYNGGGRGARLDFTGGLSLEGGRTNVTMLASWTRTNPIFNSDRPSLTVDARRQAIANDPNFYRFFSPLGATPNIRNPSGQPLTLDDRFGGGVLSSYYTFAPEGYRGLALDGVTPLVSHAGQLNLGLAENTARGGGGSELVFGSQQAAMSVAVRRDMNDWLKVYAELGWTRADRRARSSAAPSTILLDADAPNNPFTQSVFVTVPFPNANERTDVSRTQTYRGVFGMIAKLPYDWQAVVDLSRSRTSASATTLAPALAQEGLDSFRNGGQDILRDVRLMPAITYDFADVPYSYYASPQRNDITTLSLRLAGSLPIDFPGGRPTVTLSAERNVQRQAAYLFAQNDFSQSSVDLRSAGRLQIGSIYGEINIPLVGKDHTLPLVQEFSITLAARHESYTERGSPQTSCFFDFDYLPTNNIASLCPDNIASALAKRSHTNPTVSVRWRPVSGITFRGSFATGYITPRLNQLVREPAQQIFTNALDPARGNERIGTPDEFTPEQSFLPGFAGGNNNVRPETSKTFTAGVIFQPRFLSGLRLSVDWTRITKRDNYFDPAALLFPNGDPERQAEFETFLAQYPDRFVRGPASGGFAVGPITSIDVSLANLLGSTSESIDFAASYDHALLGGTINFDARATYVRKLSLQEVPGGPTFDFAGVVGDDFIFSTDGGGFGSVRWKGSGSLRWTGKRLSMMWQARFFDRYFVNVDRSFNTSLGAATIPRQFYHDVSASYAFDGGLTIRAGINNLFNKRPPLDTSIAARLYSSFGDPRGANGYVTVVKSF